MATVLLRLPLLRHVWGAMGCVPADYAPVRTLLASTSVGLVPEVCAYTGCMHVVPSRMPFCAHNGSRSTHKCTRTDDLWAKVFSIHISWEGLSAI